MTRYDDETLMAFADGMLDDPLLSEIADAVEKDPDLAERVAGLARARDLVRDLHAPLGDMPVPRSLAGAVAAAVAASRAADPRVVPLDRRRRPSAPVARFWPMAAAAAVAALIAGPVGFMLAGPPAPPSALAVGQPVPTPYADALAALSSGLTEDLGAAGRLRTIATFQDASGQLCREFEVDRTNALVAVACRADADWRVTFAVEAALADGYAPASSMAALEAYLGAIDAGDPMSIEAEAAALAQIRSGAAE
jgi:hypothetical protein